MTADPTLTALQAIVVRYLRPDGGVGGLPLYAGDAMREIIPVLEAAGYGTFATKPSTGEQP